MTATKTTIASALTVSAIVALGVDMLPPPPTFDAPGLVIDSDSDVEKE